ncbi:hypothetical protein D9M72_475300 [compost metagenome]
MAVARWWLEAIGGKLDQQPKRVLEIDRVHETAVLDAAVPDTSLVEPLHRLGEGRARNGKGDVVHTADLRRGSLGIGLAVLVGEDGDQAAIARVEIEMAFARPVEIRLLENEGHAEKPLPEIDRRLSVGADERDVMNPLRLQFSHRRPPR